MAEGQEGVEEQPAGEEVVAKSIEELEAEKQEKQLAALAAKDQEDAKGEEPPAAKAVASITITVFDNETVNYQPVGPLDRHAVRRLFEVLANGAAQQPLFPPAVEKKSAED